MMKPVAHFKRVYHGHSVFFLRVGNNYGWHANVNGAWCGDFVASSDPDLADPDEIKNFFDLLQDQAQEKVERILRNQGEFKKYER